MCLAVYLASEVPLPLVPWKDMAPAFHVSDRVPDRSALTRHLTMPHLRSAGSYTGCGCEFLLDGVDPGTHAYDLTRGDYRQLARYLQQYATGRVVPIYACWGGDEGAAPEHLRRVGVAEIEREGFTFAERELLLVETFSSPTMNLERGCQ